MCMFCDIEYLTKVLPQSSDTIITCGYRGDGSPRNRLSECTLIPYCEGISITTIPFDEQYSAPYYRVPIYAVPPPARGSHTETRRGFVEYKILLVLLSNDSESIRACSAMEMNEIS
jgi:hypothetical protein